MARMDRDQQYNHPYNQPDRDRRNGGWRPRDRDTQEGYPGRYDSDRGDQRASDGSQRGYDDDYGQSRGNEYGNANTWSDYGPSRGSRTAPPGERQRWDDDGGNRGSYQRGGADQGDQSQHEAWSTAGMDDTWNRQQSAWKRSSEGSQPGQERWQTRAPDSMYRSQERWNRGDVSRTGMESSGSGPDGSRAQENRIGATDRVSHRGKGPKNFKRSDEQIQHEISQRLFDHHDVDASEIEVKFEGGEATLTGTVPDRQMKRLAGECVEDCYGVSNCQNNLRVGTTAAGADTGGSAKPADKSGGGGGVGGNSGTGDASGRRSTP